MISEDFILKGKEKVSNIQDAGNFIREKLQIIIISSLENTDFYNNFAFTGGTCLRIMHHAQRYSEDLDFDSINKEYKEYDFFDCFKVIQNYFKLFDINCFVEYKEKKKPSSIKTFNLNFSEKEVFNRFGFCEYAGIKQRDQKLKIKFEVETDFNKGEKFENLEGNFPLYLINTVEKGSMMANKLNAILRRNENTNIKGRDFFDLKYYIDNNIELNLELFNYCFKRDGYTLNDIERHDDPPKNKEELIKLIQKKIKNIDFNVVIGDLTAFVENRFDYSIYNKEYFCELATKINVNYNNLEQENE